MDSAKLKPWIAGVLILVAIGMVGRNVVGPMFEKSHSPTPSAAKPPPAPTANTSAPMPSQPVEIPQPSTTAKPSPFSETESTDSLSVVEDTLPLSEWINDLSRDPFGSMPRGSRRAQTASNSLDGGRPAHDAGATNQTGQASTPLVSAIAWGPGRMALVDGIAIQIGDSLMGGQVRDIRSDRLVLRKGSRDTVLLFWEGKKK